jgi:hypothetical protein
MSRLVESSCPHDTSDWDREYRAAAPAGVCADRSSPEAASSAEQLPAIENTLTRPRFQCA